MYLHSSIRWWLNCFILLLRSMNLFLLDSPRRMPGSSSRHHPDSRVFSAWSLWVIRTHWLADDGRDESEITIKCTILYFLKSRMFVLHEYSTCARGCVFDFLKTFLTFFSSHLISLLSLFFRYLTTFSEVSVEEWKSSGKCWLVRSHHVGAQWNENKYFIG